MKSVARPQDGQSDADALDRELDEALEQTFPPAIRSRSIDTAETHKERHKDRGQEKE